MKRMSTTWHGLICMGVLLVVAGCAKHIPVTGLRPEYPNVGPAYVKVDSLKPTFRWEPFPRPQDYEADKEGVLRRINHVTYDLKILRAEDDYPIELIYARQGLPDPSHSIEEPLEPSTKYYWTIRARFELDSNPRITQWGQGGGGSGRQVVVPESFYYRFKTPRK